MSELFSRAWLIPAWSTGRNLFYWAVMVKPNGRPAAITVGDAAVTGAGTSGLPVESM